MNMVVFSLGVGNTKISKYLLPFHVILLGLGECQVISLLKYLIIVNVICAVITYLNLKYLQLSFGYC